MVKKEPIKIILAEDHAMFRESLISVLNEEPNFKVIGEADNGRKLIDVLKKEEPDVLLLDIEMPIMNGHEAFKLIRKKHPALRVIIVSMYDEAVLMSEFMFLGARGYLTKCSSTGQLFQAINKVHNEGFYFDDKTSKALLNGVKKEKLVNTMLNNLSLTKREIEILREICEGKTNTEISKTLNISANTVDFHRKNIYKKANCKNLADIMKYAIKQGYMEVT